MKQVRVYVILGMIAGLFLYCANPIAPTGGDKDETPPQIDSTKSTPNFLTNFEKQRIQITFDEWIKLEDKLNQIIVSPPLGRNAYVVNLRGKTVRFEFNEETILKDSVTYTINFGESIQDITESNKLLNYRFVFSTGEYIDSLTLAGLVLDSETEEPVEGATILLHENLADSVIYTELPIYFGKTNEEGQFLLENLKSGTYKIVAILEQGLSNYKYEPYVEKIGFLNQTISLPDTSIQDVHFTIFLEESPLEIVSRKANRFVTKIAFNRPPDSIPVFHNQTQAEIIEQLKQDTLYFWHKNLDYPFEFYHTMTDKIDTITVVEDTTWSLDFPLRSTSNLKIRGFYYLDSLSLSFNQPVMIVDTGLAALTDTAGLDVPFQIRRENDRQKLFVVSDFRPLQDYVLTLFPGSIVGYHSTLSDTVQISLSTGDIESFGTILLTLNDLDSTQQYIVRLKKNEDILYEEIVKGISINEMRIGGIKPGSYMIQVIEDKNRNKQWDTGNYLEKVFPEKISNQEVSNLKANWEMNVTFNWKRTTG